MKFWRAGMDATHLKQNFADLLAASKDETFPNHIRAICSLLCQPAGQPRKFFLSKDELLAVIAASNSSNDPAYHLCLLRQLAEEISSHELLCRTLKVFTLRVPDTSFGSYHRRSAVDNVIVMAKHQQVENQFLRIEQLFCSEQEVSEQLLQQLKKKREELSALEFRLGKKDASSSSDDAEAYQTCARVLRELLAQMAERWFSCNNPLARDEHQCPAAPVNAFRAGADTHACELLRRLD